MLPKAVDIKVIVEAGATAPDAIKTALPGGPAAFADKHRLSRSHVSRCIHGRQRHARIRRLLAAELGVELQWLNQLLDEHRRGKAA